MINNEKRLGEFNDFVFNATCINIIARFVQVARHQENQEIRLQDKNILTKVSDVAETTENQHLVLLYRRLSKELDKITAREQKPNAQSWTVASTLKRWGLGLSNK